MTIESGWQKIVEASLGINKKMILESDKQSLNEIFFIFYLNFYLVQLMYNIKNDIHASTFMKKRKKAQVRFTI